MMMKTKLGRTGRGTREQAGREQSINKRASAAEQVADKQNESAGLLAFWPTWPNWAAPVEGLRCCSC